MRECQHELVTVQGFDADFDFCKHCNKPWNEQIYQEWKKQQAEKLLKSQDQESQNEPVFYSTS